MLLNVASPKNDIFWSCEPYGQSHISKVTTTWLHTWTSVERKTKKETARQHSGGLWGHEYVYTWSISPQLRPDKMEKHCSQLGLPEREDNVFVAKVISHKWSKSIDWWGHSLNYTVSKMKNVESSIRPPAIFYWLLAYTILTVNLFRHV